MWRAMSRVVVRKLDVDMIDVEQLDIQARNVRRIALVVVEHQLHWAPEQSSPGIDVISPDVHRQNAGLADGRETASLRLGESDGDGRGVGGPRGSGDRAGGRHAKGRTTSEDSSHVVPPGPSVRGPSDVTLSDAGQFPKPSSRCQARS